MELLLQMALVAGVATLLAAWCGWGLARLTLPVRLQKWNGLLGPLLGYALVLLVAYLLVHNLAGLPVVLLLLIPATGLLNFWAWRRSAPPRMPARPQQHLPLLLLLIATLVVGLLPLFSYGHAAVIGANWDVENYLPMARYLERGPVSAIASAPPNPLRDLNATPPTIGLTLGFSIWHGSIDLLTGQEAIISFAIILAWLRALGVVGLYVLFRSSLGLRRPYALLGAAFASAGALLLWVSYFNFGMQMAAWPLLPLGLVVGIEAMKEGAGRGLRAWPCLIGAGVALAALPVAYYPALTLFIPLALGLGIPALAQSKQRVRLLTSTAALGLFVALLSIPAILDYMQGFNYRYSQQLTTLGLFRYIPLTDMVGFTAFSQQSDGSVPLWALVATVLFAGACLVGLVWGRDRFYCAGLIAGAVAYMAWIRWGQQYPYAYMKGASYAAFPFLGLGAMGLQAIVERRVLAFARWGVVGVSLALLALMGISQGQVVAEHWSEPGLYAGDVPGVLAVRGLVPAGSKVTLTSDPRAAGVTTGLLAYVVDEDMALGSGNTGYAQSWSSGAPDEIGDYALLLTDEDPEPLGFPVESRIWQGGSFALYRKPPAVLAHLQVDRTLAPGEEMKLGISAAHITDAPGSAVQPDATGSRALALSLASFTPGKLSVDGASITLQPGGYTFTTAPMRAPQEVSLRNQGAGPLTLRWATLLDAQGPAQQGDSLVPERSMVLAQASAVSKSNLATTTLRTLVGDAGPVTLALDIWDLKRGLHYGWYGLEQQHTNVARTLRLSLDLPTGTMRATDGSGAAVAVGGGLNSLKPGDYVARLNVMAGTRTLASPEDLFGFKVEAGGRVSGVRAGSTPLIATTVDRPAVPLDVRSGNELKLLGYDLSSSQVRPGDDLQITLWWQALSGPLDERSVLIHLRDSRGDKRAQADGPPANGGRPTTTWRKGEVIVDAHTVKLPGDLPPGDYTLLVGMYHYPSVQLVPLSDGDIPVPGSVVSVPIEVKR